MVWSSMITNPTNVKPKSTTCSFKPVIYSAFCGSGTISFLVIESGGIGADSGLEAMAETGCEGVFAFSDSEALLSDEGRVSVIFRRKFALVSQKFEISGRRSPSIRVTLFC